MSLVRRAGDQAQPAQHRRRQRLAVGRREAVQRLAPAARPRLTRRAGAGELAQVPEHRLRLAAEAVEPGVVEIGGDEVGIVARQEAVGPVVEALAGDVHVVGVEHAVHETRPPSSARRARRRCGRPRPRAAPPAGSRRRCRAPGSRSRTTDRELGDQLGALQGRVALESPEADMAVRQAGQHRRRASGWARRCAAAPRRSRSARRCARSERPAPRAWPSASTSRTPPFSVRRPSPRARPRRLARALGPQVEEPPGPRLAQLGEQEAATVAEIGVVNAELMAVVAHRQRLRLVAGQRLEASEVRAATPRRSAHPAPPSLPRARCGSG